MNSEIPKIKNAVALSGYKLHLSFQDGVDGIVDLSEFVGRGVFEYWNDEENFKKFEIIWNAITWNEIIDIDADSFYLQIIDKTYFEYARN
ncbi:MAG: hypothetical protein RLZZ312_378 [Bacteroidota bacterium]|jgi:hypothetical protein